MRFIHTSDLHIGKVVNGFSMLEEQKAALDQIIAYAGERHVDAVLLSGDLYDRSIPPAAAVCVLDGFLTKLVDMGITVAAIAGNHDCGERIGFAGGILKKKGLYMAGKLAEPMEYADVTDQWGTVRIHMMPFARPSQVKAFYRVEEMGEDYESTVKELLNHRVPNREGREILLCHQFAVWNGKEPEVSDSETRLSAGGADQVDVRLFQDFSYTALGHIHGCQQIGGKTVYYSGSPVKYSFSEIYHKKCVLFGDLGKDGQVALEKLPITPIHDMRKIRGRLGELIQPSVVEAADQEDYILAVLTDEAEVIDPIGTLRSVYPNVMQLQWEKKGDSQQQARKELEYRKEKEPFSLFEDFFSDVTGKELTKEQQAIICSIIERAGEETQ